MRFSDRKLSGLLAFTGGVECIVGIGLAEDLYPGYSVSANPISDLGATCRATCTILQPSATIFDSTVIILGVLGIGAAYLVSRWNRRMLLPSLLFLAGIGAIGVGVFPETTGIVHVVVSLIVFLFGGLSAVASFQVLESPMNYLSILIGAVTLVALVLYSTQNYAGLGQGGMERMIAYPALLWFVGFGAYLMKT